MVLAELKMLQDTIKMHFNLASLKMGKAETGFGQKAGSKVISLTLLSYN